MLEKFKNLSKRKKIIIGIIAFMLLPITLLVLGVDLSISGFKNKNRGKMVGGIAITIFMLFALVTSENTDADIATMEESPTNLYATIDESEESTIDKEVSKNEDSSNESVNKEDTEVSNNTEDIFAGYKLIEVDGGNLSGNREPNVVVDIGFGDREYWAFTNEYGRM